MIGCRIMEFYFGAESIAQPSASARGLFGSRGNGSETEHVAGVETVANVGLASRIDANSQERVLNEAGDRPLSERASRVLDGSGHVYANRRGVLGPKDHVLTDVEGFHGVLEG